MLPGVCCPLSPHRMHGVCYLPAFRSFTVCVHFLTCSYEQECGYSHISPCKQGRLRHCIAMPEHLLHIFEVWLHKTHLDVLKAGTCVGCQASQWLAGAPDPSVAALSHLPPGTPSAAAGAQLQTSGVSKDPSLSTSTDPGAQPMPGGGGTTLADARQGMASNPNRSAPSWVLPLAAAGIGAAGALLAVAAVGCVALAVLATARESHAQGGRGRHSAPPAIRPNARVVGDSFAAVGPATGRGCPQPRSLRSLYSCSEINGPCKVLIPEDTAATSNGGHPTRGPKSPPANRHCVSAAENPNVVCHPALAADPDPGHHKHASASVCMRPPPPAAAWPSPGSGFAAGLGLPFPAGPQQGQWPYIPARPPPYPAIVGVALDRHSTPAAEDGPGSGGAGTLPAVPVVQRKGAGPENGDRSHVSGDELAALQKGGCSGAGALANGWQQGPLSAAGPRVSGRLQGTALLPSPFVELTYLPFYD